MAQMTPEKLAQTIVWYETIYEKLGKLGTFAFLNGATQRTDGEAMQFQAKVNERSTNISADLVFFSLELNAIDDARDGNKAGGPGHGAVEEFCGTHPA